MKYMVMCAIVQESTFKEEKVGEVQAKTKKEAERIVAVAVIEGTLPKGSVVTDPSRLPN
jgi:hypothetical protein